MSRRSLASPAGVFRGALPFGEGINTSSPKNASAGEASRGRVKTAKNVPKSEMSSKPYAVLTLSRRGIVKSPLYCMITL